jgi:hypothetical protein
LEGFFYGSTTILDGDDEMMSYKEKVSKAFVLLCNHFVKMWKVLEMHFVMCIKWKQFKITLSYESFSPKNARRRWHACAINMMKKLTNKVIIHWNETLKMKTYIHMQQKLMFYFSKR